MNKFFVEFLNLDREFGQKLVFSVYLEGKCIVKSAAGRSATCWEESSI